MRTQLKGYVCDNDSAGIYRRWGYTDVCCPEDVRAAIAACPEGEDLIFEINSGGGSVYAGFEMYSMIRSHKGRTVAEVQSLAASAASVFMAACDEVLISPVANVMIHRSATWAVGNSEDMDEAKQMLDTIDESILAAYTEKVGDKTSREELRKLMEAETFLTAERAIELGLCDGILPPGSEGEENKTALAVAAIAGLPPIEDLRRMEREAHGESGEPPVVPGPGAVIDLTGGEGGAETPPTNRQTDDRGDLGGLNNQARSDAEVDHIETMEQLAEAYPDLVEQIRAQAASEAATAERERLNGIDEVAVAGFESIIAAAKADPEQNAGTVAMAIIKAQKEAGTNFLEDRKGDAETVNQVPGAQAPEGEAEGDADKEAEAAGRAAAKAFYGKKED